MITLKDFTVLSAGSEIVGEGSIETCPRCGRSGIAQMAEGQVIGMLHARQEEPRGDGMVSEPQDWCRITESAD